MSVFGRLLEKFHDFAYRHAYASSFSDSYLATQIQVIREQRGWTQEELAKAAGMKQSQISKLEDVDNGSWQGRTLKRIAKALDVALVVRFETFSTLLPDIESFGREALQRQAFKDDSAFDLNSLDAGQAQDAPVQASMQTDPLPPS